MGDEDRQLEGLERTLAMMLYFAEANKHSPGDQVIQPGWVWLDGSDSDPETLRFENINGPIVHFDFGMNEWFDK